ncbi:MAG: hypothetical protein QXE05_13175 [Nitrososphaeria archaeon]
MEKRVSQKIDRDIYNILDWIKYGLRKAQHVVIKVNNSFMTLYPEQRDLTFDNGNVSRFSEYIAIDYPNRENALIDYRDINAIGFYYDDYFDEIIIGD